MKMRGWLRRFGAGLLVVTMLAGSGLFMGCNEGADFDPDLLFSMEDFAQDQDYAFLVVWMMDNWYKSMHEGKQYLDGNNPGLPFTEAVPPGWNQVDPASRAYPWSITYLPDGTEATDETQWLDDGWYYYSFQDAVYQFARFDEQVPADNELVPAQVEYMNFQFTTGPQGQVVALGDSVSIYYTNDYLNQSRLQGEAMYSNVRLLLLSGDNTGDIANTTAIMYTILNGDLTGLSAEPNNPQGQYTVTGETLLQRLDLSDQVTLDVEVNVNLRANNQGEGNIVVDGVERARVFFEFYDSDFDGYYTLRSTNFRERNNF